MNAAGATERKAVQPGHQHQASPAAPSGLGMLALPAKHHRHWNVNGIAIVVGSRGLRIRLLRIRGLVFVVCVVGVVRVDAIFVAVAMLRWRPEEVPMKVRGRVMFRGFLDASSAVGMGEVHPLEEQQWDQE